MEQVRATARSAWCGREIASPVAMNDDRFHRLVVAIMLFNITVMLLGALGYAWLARRDASRPAPPTNRVHLVGDFGDAARG